MIKKRQILLVGGDILLLYLSLFITLWLRLPRLEPKIISEHVHAFSILYPIWLIIFYFFDFYDLHSIKPSLTFLTQFSFALGLNFVIGVLFFYSNIFSTITPKTNLFVLTIIFGVLFLVWRYLFYLFFRSHFQENVAIIGLTTESISLAKKIKNNPNLGYKMVLFFKTDPKINYRQKIGIKIKDIKQDIRNILKKKQINTLIIAKNLKSKSLRELLPCLSLKINFLDLAQAYEEIEQIVPISSITPTWFLENLKEGKKRVYDKTKRIIDIILASFFLILSSPLWVLIALAIKIEDRGTVIFRQIRIGKNGENFVALKFRSMTEKSKGRKPLWTKKEDRRITKVGKILRKTHFDELPQLINIIRGDMSIVGPRPEKFELGKKFEREIPFYRLRYIIKPGLTGWAQVKFRYARNMKDNIKKFEYDLYYIKNRSILLDLGILFKTVILIFRREE